MFRYVALAMTIRDFMRAKRALRRAPSHPCQRLSGRSRIRLMDRESLEERLRAARERAQRWKGESERLEGIKRVSDRKRETRKKIWAGGWLLNVIKDDAIIRRKFTEHLRSVKFRKGEREMFSDVLGDAPIETAIDHPIKRQNVAEHPSSEKAREGERQRFCDVLGEERTDARAGAGCPRTPADTEPR
jgi:hypothetical protein